MEAVLLSRIQFGLTAAFHFLFPPLTIGLATLLAVMEFNYWRTGEGIYDKMSRFWFKLFAIIFTVGIATGITMEFQFGTNWSEYSKFVGDIFGAPLAAEGVFAFFLESTFMGLLTFGREKLSRRMRFAASLMVALGSTLSAFWIIVANSWQQTPAAFKLQGGRAVLTDFFGAVFNPSTVPRYLHTVDAAYITGAFFVMGISAFFLLRNKNTDIAKPSLKISLIFALIAVLAQGVFGDIHARQVALTQPAKAAAFEGLWESQKGASLNLIGLPDSARETTHMAVGVPKLLSRLIFGDANAEVKGLKAFTAENRPPVAASYWSYRVMLLLAGWFVMLVLSGSYLLLKGKIYSSKTFLTAVLYSTPLPLLTNEAGWFAAEIGRQPFVVYGVLKTQIAASPLPAVQVLASTLMFVVLYAALVAGVIYLIRKEIMKASSSGKIGGEQAWT